MDKMNIDTETQKLKENPFAGYDRATLEKLLPMLEAKKREQDMANIKSRLGGFADTAANVFFQSGGIKLPEPKMNDMNTIIQKAILEDYIKSQTPEGKLARQKAQFELGQGAGTTQPVIQPTISPVVQPTISPTTEITPTETMPLTTEKAPSQYINKPSEKFPGYEVVENPDYKNWQQKQVIGFKGETKQQEAEAKAKANFGRISSGIEKFVRYYAGGLKEGGVGNWWKKIKGKTATGVVGGEWGEKYPETGKLIGQRQELAMSLVPILTNQNRFIESVMKAILKTFPVGVEGPQLAKAKFHQTLENSYGVTKVLTRLGINPEILNNMNDADAETLANQALEEAGYNKKTGQWALKDIYRLTPAERKEFEVIATDIFKPLDELSSRSAIPTITGQATTGQGNLPKVGEMFQGQRVTKVTRIK